MLLVTDKIREHIPRRNISLKRAGEVKIIINKCNGKLTKILEKCQRKKIKQLEKKNLSPPILLAKVNNKCRYHADD